MQGTPLQPREHKQPKATLKSTQANPKSTPRQPKSTASQPRANPSQSQVNAKSTQAGLKSTPSQPKPSPSQSQGNPSQLRRYFAPGRVGIGPGPLEVFSVVVRPWGLGYRRSLLDLDYPRGDYHWDARLARLGRVAVVNAPGAITTGTLDWPDWGESQWLRTAVPHAPGSG